jgi:hypothetical protein
MKRVLAILLAAVTLVSLCACESEQSKLTKYGKEQFLASGYANEVAEIAKESGLEDFTAEVKFDNSKTKFDEETKTLYLYAYLSDFRSDDIDRYDKGK